MVQQQKCLNIQPKLWLQPSFLISVYFYIMALFQWEKHVLLCDPQGWLTICFQQFFLNISASPTSRSVILPGSWVLSLGPFLSSQSPLRCQVLAASHGAGGASGSPPISLGSVVRCCPPWAASVLAVQPSSRGPNQKHTLQNAPKALRWRAGLACSSRDDLQATRLWRGPHSCYMSQAGLWFQVLWFCHGLTSLERRSSLCNWAPQCIHSSPALPGVLGFWVFFTTHIFLLQMSLSSTAQLSAKCLLGSRASLCCQTSPGKCRGDGCDQHLREQQQQTQISQV